MCPARRNPSTQAAYERCASSSCPPAQRASPAVAAAPARVRWSSSAAMEVATSAWAMVAAGSPWISDSAERYSSTAAGSRSHSARSMTIGPGGPPPSPSGPGPRGVARDRRGALGGGELSTGHQCPDEAERQHRSCLHHLVRDDLEPGGDGGLLPVPLQRRHRELGEVRCPVDVTGGDRVPHGRDRFTRFVVPLAGAAVQVCDLLGPLVEEMGPDDFGEQVVVAVPATVAVQRDEEQVGPVQVLEHVLAARVAGHGLAQRSAHPVEDRGLEQEVTHLRRLTVEHLFGQVVHDVAVVAGEGGDERRGVCAPPQGQRRELQGGDPALGAGLQRRDVARSDREGGDVVEVRRGLGQREAQVGGTDLDQLAPRAQSGQWQRRVHAGADDQVHLGRKVLDAGRTRSAAGPGCRRGGSRPGPRPGRWTPR